MDLKVRNTSEYEKFSIDDTLKALETSMDGLIESGVEDRLKTFGYNEIVEKKKTPFLEFLLRYWGPMPVALPAVLTIVQAVGAMELAKKGALVTRLDSIEDAASIDVLCLDKTGTITQNRLSVTDIMPLSEYKSAIRLSGLRILKA